MEQFSTRELCARRDAYQIRIQDRDFFVVRHLKKFIYTQIPYSFSPECWLETSVAVDNPPCLDRVLRRKVSWYRCRSEQQRYS
jgi:hypothetical protein